jgi:tetratricopeptide (TPR) repeat protein
MKTINGLWGWILILSLASLGCASSFKVVTQPEEAEVLVVNMESGETKKIGTTPIEKKGTELREELGDIGTPGGFVQLRVQKEGFQTQDLWVPVSAGGALATEISLSLKAVDPEQRAEEIKKASEILERIFLAQQFARTQQFERAFIEIDKVLEAFPDLARAQSMKAAIYFARGDLNDSLTWYERAIASDPQFTQAIEMAARVRQALNLPPGAQPAGGGP